MSTALNLPATDKGFISVLLDEWMKESHCLDSKEAWDADPKRPFPSEVIMLFLKYSGLSVVEDLGRPMMEQSIARIDTILHNYGISPVQLYGQYIFIEDHGEGDSRTRAALKKLKLSSEDIESILRLGALCINVLNGVWPFGHVGTSGGPSDKAK